MLRRYLPKGENNFSGIVACGCTAFSLIYYLKHAALVDYYKQYTSLCGQDGPINPSDRLITMVKEVEQDVKSLTSEFTPISSYIVPGLRVLNVGTLGTMQGGAFGLPQYFEFWETEDVDNKIKRTSSVIDETPIEELYDRFLLSDKAKKYGIAREILSINSYQVHIEALIPLVIAGLVHLSSNHIFSQFNVLTMNPVGRAIVYTLFTVTGLLIWRNVHSIAKNYSEEDLEETVASLGKDYIEGAIEFYNKALERRSLKLEFKDQDSQILKTISDKVDYIVSRRLTPISHKLDFYKTKLSVEDTQNNKTTIELEINNNLEGF